MRQTTTARSPDTAGQQPITWTDVRTWAAGRGLTSAAALRDWLDDAARRVRGGQPVDPRETLLLRALARYARMIPAGGSVPPIGDINGIYQPLLATLVTLGPGIRSLSTHAPGINGADWLAPVVDPLAEDGRLWPPTPVTLAARIAEVTSGAFGYDEPDTSAIVRSLSSETSRDPIGFSRQVTRDLSSATFGLRRALQPLGALRARPDAIRLASAESIDEARTRGLDVMAYRPAPPFVITVAQGHSRGTPDSSAGPVHVASIIVGREVPVVLATSDSTGDMIGFENALYGSGDEASRPSSQAVDDAIADLLGGLVDAVRAGLGPGIGFEPLGGTTYRQTHWRFVDINEPFYGRAFEPAEVLAAIGDRVRKNAAQRINAALSVGDAGGVRSLAGIAARAYRGNLTGVNAPEEVIARIAAQVASDACSPDASDAERARIGEAASALGVRGSLLEDGDPMALCDASASAVERLYGRAYAEA